MVVLLITFVLMHVHFMWLDSTPRSSRSGPSITVSKPDGAEGPPTVISHRERKNSDPGATNEDPEVTVDKGMSLITGKIVSYQ